MNVIDMFRKLRGERRETAAKAYWRLIAEQANAHHRSTSADLQKTASTLDELAAGLGFNEADVVRHLEQVAELVRIGDTATTSATLQREQAAINAAQEREAAEWLKVSAAHEATGERLAADMNHVIGRFRENGERQDRALKLRKALDEAGAPADLLGEVAR